MAAESPGPVNAAWHSSEMVEVVSAVGQGADAASTAAKNAEQASSLLVLQLYLGY